MFGSIGRSPEEYHQAKLSQETNAGRCNQNIRNNQRYLQVQEWAECRLRINQKESVGSWLQ